MVITLARLLARSLAASLPRSLAASQPSCLAASLPRNLALGQSRTSSLGRSRTSSLGRSRTLSLKVFAYVVSRGELAPETWLRMHDVLLIPTWRTLCLLPLKLDARDVDVHVYTQVLVRMQV